MKKSLVFRSFPIWGLVGALVINAAMFCLLPVLISTKENKTDLESLNVIHMARMKPIPPAPAPEKKEKPEKPTQEKPEKIFRCNAPKPRQVPHKPLKMSLPAMDLAIDPRIAGGVPMVAPPPALPSPDPGPDFNAVMAEDELDTIPIPRYKSPPRYPYRAKRLGIGGEVKIRFLVDKQGNVSDITILEAQPPEIFDQSVRDAVSKWQYSPGELLGRKVATLVTTTVVFQMEVP